MAAVARAMHLLHHGPRALLTDWLAWPLVGARAEKLMAATPPVFGEARHPFMTWFAARTRLTEDWLGEASARQYVILGAGLDSFAWRQSDGVEVFEVDEPGSQRAKQERIAALGLGVPDALTWVPLDLEQRRVGDTLMAAGVDAACGVFVSWLGVIPYLTGEAIGGTLRQLPVCRLAIAYVPPEELWDESARAIGRHVQAQVRELGEPWISLLSPEEMASALADAGFDVIEDLGAPDIATRFGLPCIHHERIVLARSNELHLSAVRNAGVQDLLAGRREAASKGLPGRADMSDI